MGYDSNSHMTLAKEKKSFKFNKKIIKHRRHVDHQNNQQRKQRPHTYCKRHYKNRSPCQLYTMNFSPQYKPTQPMITIRPLSYSDEYKPLVLGLEEETNNETYSGYIDSLMLLKMQIQEQRNQELIEKLGRITFEDNSVNKEGFIEG